MFSPKKRRHNEAFIEDEENSFFNRIAQSKELQHIMENIFMCLNPTDLIVCKSTCKYLKQVFENPYFLLKKWMLSGLSKGNP